MMTTGDDLAILASATAPLNPLAPQSTVLDGLRAQELLRSFERVSELSRYSQAELDATDRWVILTYGNTDRGLLGEQLGVGSLTPTGLIANTYVVSQPAGWNWKLLAGTLTQHVEVAYAYPLVKQQQGERFIPNDTLFGDQWHLRNTGQTGGTVGADANVELAWDQFRGDNVVIGIVDDGLEFTHPDLAGKYQAGLSFDYADNDNDPSPDVFFDHHGTAVAGVAAASTNNNLGVAGAAPNALLAGLRLTSSSTDDLQEAGALSHQAQQIDIYNNSWGPPDGFAYLEAPGPLTLAAIQQGTLGGRGGLGSIYAWAGGNGLDYGDNSNYDGYANSRYTISIGAINHLGRQSYYSESGANVLVAAYSNDDVTEPGITTTDVVGTEGYSSTDYADDFGGTSSATPLVSGVIALMLQANPNLTWRDVQHILVRTAERNDTADAGWTNNGAGLHVNHKYGFGAIDALAAVNLAQTWTTVGAEVAASTNLVNVNAAIPDNNATGVTRTVNVTQDVTLESIEIVFDASHNYSGDLEIVLTSPSGTQSILAEEHFDATPYDNWVFTSVRHWGESSRGAWTITVRDRAASDAGTFNHFQINFFGTAGPLFTPTGQVTGLVWSDRDGDGTRDAGEPGLGGFTVYADLNNNSLRDANEPSAISQPNGTYTLFSMPAGNYTIRQVVQPFYQQTFPASGGGQAATIVGNGTVANINFGNLSLIGDGPYTLTNAAGDGTVTVGVDGYGAFGSSVGADSENAIYDPVGPIASAGTTFESGIAIGFTGQTGRTFLTSGNISGTSSLTNPLVTGSSTLGNSSFTFQSLAATLEQELLPTFDANNARTGSLLRQTYIFTNTSTSTLSFDIVRYLDGDLYFDGSLTDGGGRIVRNGNEVLFETDSATGTASSSTFVGIYTQGGIVPTTNRYEVDSFSGLKTRIAAGNALDNQVTGDGPDADQFVDLNQGYDVTLALRNVFSIPAGQSAVYVTTTIFGTGAPEDFVVEPPPPPPPPPPTTISGTIFTDTNGDGVQGATEPGLAGLLLFVDLDENGTIGLGEPAVYTDANGNYAFVGLEPGTYSIRPVPTAGYEVLAPAGGAISVTVTQSETVANNSFAIRPQFDYGDAPNSYGTLRAQNGPVHGIVPGYHLGLVVDAETNGQPNATASGDDANGLSDDDGVRFLGVLLPGTSVPIEVYASQTGGLAGTPVQGVLQGWIDFNGDGDFLDPGERVVTNRVLNHGVNNFNIFVPSGAKVGQTYARFRLGLEPNLAPTGPSQAGEVEDYAISIGLLARGDAFQVLEDSSGNLLNVLSNDILVGGGSLSLLSVGTPNQGGTVALAAGGAVNYTPAANFYGLETFTYTVSNGLGATAVGTVSINVQNTNDPPTANADSLTVVQNQANVLLDVLANDSYLPDPIEVLTVTSFTPPANGAASLAPGGAGILYTPNAGFVGSDSITYTIGDGNGGAATATAAITVRINNPPTAVGDSFQVDENSIGFLLDVLANDSTAPDAGETLSIQAVTQGSAGGTVVIGAGVLSYTPVRGFEGTETFTYTVNDGFGLTATATVTITIRPNVPPVAVGDSYNLDENSTGNILNVLSNDSDSDGTIVPGTIQIMSGPTSGTATVNANGTITYNAAAGFAGNATFTYRVADDDGDFSNTATVTLRVRNAPVANNDSYSVNERQTLIVPAAGILANDVGFGALTPTALTQPANGTLSLNPDGSFTYIPNVTFNGADSFIYNVTDGVRTSNTATVTLNVIDIPLSGTASTNLNISRLAGNTFEPELVMNPNNPNQLFVVGLTENTGGGIFAAYSTNGGLTWTRTDTDGLIAEPGNAINMPVASRDIDVVWDNQNNLILAYAGAVPGEIALMFSADGGASFASGIALTYTPVATMTNFEMTWSPGSLWFGFNYATNDIDWISAPLTGTGPAALGALAGATITGTAPRLLDMAASPVNPGAMVLSYQLPGNTQGANTLGVFSDADGRGGTVGANVPLGVIFTGGQDQLPAAPDAGIRAGGALAFDGSNGARRGRLYMVIADELVDEAHDTDILLSYSDNNGATWSPFTVVHDTTAGSQFLPRVAVDPSNGHVAVVWVDTRNAGAANTTTEVWAAVSRDNGATFMEPIRVSAGTSNESLAEPPQGGYADADYGKHLGVAFRNGILHVVWSDNSNSTGDNPDGATRFDIYTARVTVNQTGDVNFGRAPSGFHNPANRFDVNFDGKVSLHDLAELASTLQFKGTRSLHGVARGPSDPLAYWDINNDNAVSLMDLASLASHIQFSSSDQAPPTLLPGVDETEPILLEARTLARGHETGTEASGTARLGAAYGIYPPGWFSNASLHDAVFASVDEEETWRGL